MRLMQSVVCDNISMWTGPVRLALGLGFEIEAQFGGDALSSHA